MPSPLPGFTHLAVHSHFTLLGATPTVAELAARAAQDGLTHLALTDRNVLYGAVAFARACRDAGVRPIVGMTLVVAQAASAPDVPDVLAGNQGEPLTGEVILLATGPAGYRSLCRLTSLLQAPAGGGAQ